MASEPPHQVIQTHLDVFVAWGVVRPRRDAPRNHPKRIHAHGSARGARHREASETKHFQIRPITGLHHRQGMYWAALILVGIVTASRGEVTTSCQWKSHGSTFDLSPLRLSNGSYNVRDSRADAGGSEDFQYIFNVCDNAPLPDVPDHACGTEPVPAYQVDTKNTGVCYTLAESKTEGWNFSFIGA